MSDSLVQAGTVPIPVRDTEAGRRLVAVLLRAEDSLHNRAPDGDRRSDNRGTSGARPGEGDAA